MMNILLVRRFAIAVVAVFAVSASAYAGSKSDVSGGPSYLGVQIRDITTDRVAPLKLKDESGVEVICVDRDAAAGRAGMHEGDVILTFNGQNIESAEQLRRLIRETPAGKTVQLGLSRDGQPVSVQATLDRRRQFGDLPHPPMPPNVPGAMSFAMPDIEVPSFNVMQSNRRSGLMVESLTAQLGEFLGVKNGSGVLVRSVEKGSAAEAAGVKAGDVIVRVNKDAVNDMGDWRRLMRRQTGKVSVGIVRDKREQTLTLDIPQRKNSSYFELPDLDGLQSELKIELSQMRPEIENAINEAHSALGVSRATLESHRVEMDKAMKISREEFEHAMEQLRNSLPSNGCKQ